MKKIFSTLALAACALVASAQLIPTGFNYQGRTSEPDGTQATFNVLNAAGETVYSQAETLKVTANGTFTVVIGNDADEAWNTINWGEGGYTINTVINDVIVSSAKLQYVPYAAYATSVAGMDELRNDVDDLVQANRERATETAELRIDVNSIGENANKAGEVAYAVAEDLEDNVKPAVDELDKFTDDFYREYGEAMSELREELVGIEQNIELLYSEEDGPIASLTSGFTMLSNVVNDQAADITALQAGLATTQGDLVELTPVIKGLQAQAAEQLLINENLEGAIPLVQQNVEDIEALQQAVELLYSEEDGPVASLTTGFTSLVHRVDDNTEAIEALQAGLDTTQGDLVELTPVIKGLQAQAAEQLLINENLEGAIPLVQQNVEDIEALQQAVELLYSEEDGPVASLTTGFTSLVHRVDDNTEAIEALQAGLDTTQGDLVELTPVIKGLQAQAAEQLLINENLEGAIPLVQQNVEDIEALQAGLAVVETDLADIITANRVNMTDIAQLKEDVAGLDQWSNEMQKDYYEAMNELREELVTLEQVDEAVTSDVQGLMEKMRGMVTIDQFNADMANIDENVSKFNEIIDVLLEQKDANDEAIANVTSDVQGLMEKMRGVATIEALNEVEATLMNVAENANLAAQTAQAAYDKADEFEEAINYISSDLQGVQELLRGKADVQDYSDIWEAIDALKREIYSMSAAIADLTTLNKH